MLEFIHLFVEVLDQYFGSVCELDLVFNFYKVYQILDEMVVGGEVMETSKLIVNRALKNTDYYDWRQLLSVAAEWILTTFRKSDNIWIIQGRNEIETIVRLQRAINRFINWAVCKVVNERLKNFWN